MNVEFLRSGPCSSSLLLACPFDRLTMGNVNPSYLVLTVCNRPCVTAFSAKDAFQGQIKLNGAQHLSPDAARDYQQSPPQDKKGRVDLTIIPLSSLEPAKVSVYEEERVGELKLVSNGCRQHGGFVSRERWKFKILFKAETNAGSCSAVRFIHSTLGENGELNACKRLYTPTLGRTKIGYE